ncbi:MAG: hypothetical protein WCN85_03965 [Burkholderiales bacterium]
MTMPANTAHHMNMTTITRPHTITRMIMLTPSPLIQTSPAHRA